MAGRQRKHHEVVDLLRKATEARKATVAELVDQGREELKRRESEPDGKAGDNAVP